LLILCVYIHAPVINGRYRIKLSTIGVVKSHFLVYGHLHNTRAVCMCSGVSGKSGLHRVSRRFQGPRAHLRARLRLTSTIWDLEDRGEVIVSMRGILFRTPVQLLPNMTMGRQLATRCVFSPRRRRSACSTLLHARYTRSNECCVQARHGLKFREIHGLLKGTGGADMC
jgi:hypothetical protein